MCDDVLSISVKQIGICRSIMWKGTILAHHYMSSLSANIYFRWEVIIIQHPDSYIRHIEVSEKIGLQKSPYGLMGGTGGPWTICKVLSFYKQIYLINKVIMWAIIHHINISNLINKVIMWAIIHHINRSNLINKVIMWAIIHHINRSM